MNRTGRSWMLKPKQKRVAFENDLVKKFSRPGVLVLKPFLRTLYTGEALLLLGKNKQFVRCEKYCGCMEMLIKGLVEVFVCQLL